MRRLGRVPADAVAAIGRVGGQDQHGRVVVLGEVEGRLHGALRGVGAVRRDGDGPEHASEYPGFSSSASSPSARSSALRRRAAIEAEHRPRDLGVRDDERPELPGGHARAADVAVGDDGRHAVGGHVEHRELAERVAGLERARVLAADADRGGPLDHQEEADAAGALLDDRLPRLVAALLDLAGELRELLVAAGSRAVARRAAPAG